MLQLTAIPVLPGIALPTGPLPEASSVEGGGIGFADLLGLALEGGLAALPAKEAVALLSADESPSASPAEAGANAPLAGMAVTVPPIQTPTQALLVALLGELPVKSDTVIETGLDLAGMSQKKLPTLPADLAVLAASPALDGRLGTGGDPALALVKVLEPAVSGKSTPAVDTSAAALATPLAAASQSPSPTPVENVNSANLPYPVNPLARETDASVAGARVTAQIAAPLASTEWRAELGDKITWMVGRQAQSAEIVLNPPSLGSIEVRLSLSLTGNEAGAQFFSANATVRDAIEAAFPRLRELMAGAGINLGEASVSGQAFADQQARAQVEQENAGASESPGSNATVGEILASGTGRLAGLVDLYI